MPILKELKDSFGNNICKINEIYDKMGEHNGGEGMRSQIEHHENGTDRRCHHYLMEAPAPVYKPKGYCGNPDNNEGVLGISSDKRVQVATEDEFFKYSHYQKTYGEINPIPQRTCNFWHAIEGWITGKPIQNQVSVLVDECSCKRTNYKHGHKGNQRPGSESELIGLHFLTADQPKHNEEREEFHGGVINPDPQAPVSDVNI